MLTLLLGASAVLWFGVPFAPLSKASLVADAPAQTPQPAAAPAKAGAAEPRQTSSLVASGYVVARRKATVAAEITGKVVEVLVDEGNAVTEGQVVARLDSVLAQKDYELAQSRVEAADAAAGAIKADLQDAERILNRTQIAVEEELRHRGRPDQGAGAGRRARRAAARRPRCRPRPRGSTPSVAGSVLDKHSIRAPFSGVVVDRCAQPGEMISPLSAGGGFTRTGVCTIVDMDRSRSRSTSTRPSSAASARRRRGQRRARCLSGLDHSRPR